MTIINSANPYFDDYDEDKQFSQILFRPGRAVQARELTQLQTFAQKQIQRFGEHIFNEGSVVYDCPFSTDLDLNFVKIQDVNAAGDAVNINTFSKDFTLTGLTSGVTAFVIAVADGLQTAQNTKTFFIKYTSSSGANQIFQNGEQIQVFNANGTLVNTVIALSANATGNSSSFTLGDGVIFAQGSFLYHISQTVILERYLNIPSKKVGIVVANSIVNSDEDESLLDPALGSSNYFATGADRAKAATVLTVLALDEEETEDFILLFEIENGFVKTKLDKPEYSILLDTLASRTFEESGDYTVKPFNIRIQEHLNTGTNGGLYFSNSNPSFIGGVVGNVNLLSVGVEPGVAFVKGFRVENLITNHLTIEKGIAFESEDQQPISFGYGNYIVVNELAGPWDIDSGTQISLRNTAAAAVTNETYGLTAAPGAQIGTARVKSVLYEDGEIGLADGEYRIYLYDVNLTANVPFANVKSIFFDDGSNADSIADVVLTSNIAVLEETSFNIGVFKFPQKAIKSLRDTGGVIDNSFQFKKRFDVTIAIDGTFTVVSPLANEEFPFGLGALNATQKRDNFVLVLSQAGETTNLTGNVTFTSGSKEFSGSGTAFTTQLKIGDRIKSAGGNVYRIANITSSTTGNIITNALGTETTVAYRKVFANGEYIDLGEIGSSGTIRSVNITSDTSASVNIEETLTSTLSAKIITDLQRTNGQETKKNLRKNRFVKIDCSTAGTGGNYNLGFSDVFRIVAIFHGTTFSLSNTDVKNQFTLDNGQRDTVYSHGRIIRNAGSSLNLTSASRILIQLDVFQHDTSTGVGFLSVDSYPIDDTEVVANTIRTENIPVYISPTSGSKFDLRDCLDIRPIFLNTSADATSEGSATTNPALPSALSVPSGGLRSPAPNELFSTDLEFFLSRKDRIFISKNNFFGVVKGISELFPKSPDEPAAGMTIAIVDIPPFPSLSSQSAKNSNRNDFRVSAQLVDNRRYTMRDIGAINQRINRLEYYSALNFLEKQASDLVIPSDATGLDRFKNGFLVDNFNGHGIGNVFDPNYKIAIDPTRTELRPYFEIDSIDFEFNSVDSTNVIRAPSDALLTLTSNTGSFATGQIVNQSGITGNIIHVVGSRLYLENVSGSFSANAVITSSTASGFVSNVITPANGDLVTLPYLHKIHAQNLFATKPRNCVGDLLFTWVGELELTPPVDTWTDTRTTPELVVNFDNNLDNWLALEEAWGTQWNDWQTNWSGVTATSSAVGGAVSVTDGDVRQLQQTTTIETVQERQARTGTNLTVTPETVNYNLGNRIVDVSVNAFIRSQIITFNAIRLKPNTTVFPFFDGILVSQHCRPIGGNFGASLVTSATGTLSGEFRIPNNDELRFPVGTTIFRLVDDNQNREGFTTTSANDSFTASGITTTQENTILSSRQARLGFTSLADSRTVESQRVTQSDAVDRFVGRALNQTFITNITIGGAVDAGGDGGGDGGGDPIAQTFINERTTFGIFITKLDVFFRTKSSTLPITLQIREVVNGFPGSKILPFGSITLTPDLINVSEDASAPTVFPFSSPVFLQDGVEYCFVLLPAGNNPDYNIWVSELGQNQLGTTNRVSEQPYVGILFTSANNRSWTPQQAEDIKFTLYRADFNINVTGTYILEPDDVDYIEVSNLTGGLLAAGDPVKFASGTGFVKEYDELNNVVDVLKLTGGIIRPKIIGTGNIAAFTGNTTISGAGTLFNTELYANAVIFSSNTNTRVGKVLNVVNDTTATIDFNSPLNLVGNSYIIFDEIVNTANANISVTAEVINDKLLNLFDTNFQTLDFLPTSTVMSFKVRDSTSNSISNFRDFLLNENTDIEREAKIASHSTESVLFSGTKSMSIRGQITTQISSLSPVIDLAKLTNIIVENSINNDATNETTNKGNALARYISKQVILDDGQDAEDLKVFITAYKPPNTDVKIFARLLNANDDTPFNEHVYTELERVSSGLIVSDAKLLSDFKEFEYRIPSALLTGPSGEFQYTSGGNIFTGYKFFAIKIILLSTNTSIVPRLLDYRALALQL